MRIEKDAKRHLIFNSQFSFLNSPKTSKQYSISTFNFNSMKKLLATICAGAVLGLMASCDDAPGKAKAYNQGINIIPTPVSLTQNEGNFKLNKNTKIYASTPEAKTVAEFFAAKMNTATGYQIATADKETSDGISLVIDGSLDVNDEGYTLDVADSGVRIKAKTPQGLFLRYAIVHC